MTPDPRIRRTRKDLGPNWVRREMPVELDILAADNEPSRAGHPAHPTHSEAGYAAGPHSLPPLGSRDARSQSQDWGRGVRPGRLTLASRLPAPSAEDSLPVIPDSDEELARLTETIEGAAQAAGAEVSIEVLQRQPSGSTDPDHPAALALLRCIAEVEGGPAPVEVCPGSLDTRWYAQLGIPAFGYGPGRLDVSHGPGEFIEEAAMRRCADVYARFAATAGRQ